MDVEIATQTILATLRWLYTRYIDTETTINHVKIEKQLTDFVFGGIANKETG
ncbi:MAG: hypothetical protein ABF295_02040 [Flavobacteriaceae bacterium]